ncbi:hypothetical protein OIU78_014166 [Salix suchowensis]|nr:hypothetical protein OIU78_014166 [Salix suchowensis]
MHLLATLSFSASQTSLNGPQFAAPSRLCRGSQRTISNQLSFAIYSLPASIFSYPQDPSQRQRISASSGARLLVLILAKTGSISSGSISLQSNSSVDRVGRKPWIVIALVRDLCLPVLRCALFPLTVWILLLEILDADFDEAAVGRVAPVDSGLLWIILWFLHDRSSHGNSWTSLGDSDPGLITMEDLGLLCFGRLVWCSKVKTRFVVTAV